MTQPPRIQQGKPAPSFALADQDDRTRKLSEFKGRWVVLYFYPRDDTPGCTVEACEFTAGLRGFRKLDAEVLGCSADSPESHRKFAKKHGLELTLLSDPDHEVMEAYGAWGDKVLYGGSSGRDPLDRASIRGRSRTTGAK
jgi:peroxiredoxin Q/BCP